MQFRTNIISFIMISECLKYFTNLTIFLQTEMNPKSPNLILNWIKVCIHFCT